MFDSPPTTTEATSKVRFRKPQTNDGAAVWSLIDECRPLDRNSIYCNLIQCDHFAQTCILAERDGDILGWISAYLMPDEPDTLFVWQVAVSRRARGQGLGKRMLGALLDRDACAGVARIKTTITPDNEASWGLFGRFADMQGAEIESEAHFKRDEHFEGRAETEHLVTIPLSEAMTEAA